MDGAFTEHLDAIQVLVAGFFVGFAGLIYYLRREDKREGYPLEDITPRGVAIEGFPPMPPPKVYHLLEGGTTAMPHDEAPSRMMAEPALRIPAAPLVPIGDPMLAEVGPGAYPLRKDEPMLKEGEPQVQPLRVATAWHVSRHDADPRGMAVTDARGEAVGTVRDLWVDRSVKILRYLEVELAAPLPAGRVVLLPIYHADIRTRRRTVRIKSLLAGHVATVPATAAPDRITAREEDRLNAYYAAGLLYSRGKEGRRRRAAAAPTDRRVPAEVQS